MSVFERYPPLQPIEFRLLRDFVYDRCGLHFDNSSMYLFDRRLGERLAALELDSFAEYYKHLRFSSDAAREFDEAIEVLTTSETYFFRQEYQLRSFEKELLPALAEKNASTKNLVLWSAGCSTGEEAYTIALMVHRSGLFDDWDVRIIGSDITKSRIAAARRGVYRAGGSFRTIEPTVRDKYFAPHPEGFQVAEFLRQYCQFGHLNLMDRANLAIVGPVDVVFCRNVLIYFDENSRRRVIDNLYRRLVSGGILLLGHSESLLNVSTAFELLHLKEDLVYMKPMRTEARQTL